VLNYLVLPGVEVNVLPSIRTVIVVIPCTHCCFSCKLEFYY